MSIEGGCVAITLFFIDMRYYRVAMIVFFCLAIEQTADSSWLSGKGMGYCMLLGLCLNANRNMEEEGDEDEDDELDEDENEDLQIVDEA